MTCPACGAENREWATHCGECGRPLPDETREGRQQPGAPHTERLPAWLRHDLEETNDQTEASSIIDRRRSNQRPPIPDGGLDRSMPTWLTTPRRERHAEPDPASRPVEHAPDTDDTPDVTTFLSPDDLPAWLRRIAEPGPAPADSSTTPPAWSPPVNPREPAVGDENDSGAFDRLPHAERGRSMPSAVAGSRDAPPDGPDEKPRVASPVVRRPPPRTPSGADTRVSAAIVAGLVVALLVIAYAVYLGVAG